MSNSYNDSQYGHNDKSSRGGYSRGNYKNNRNANGREGGGFRIRLSENEMRSARALQQAFNLKSVVAVLGFAVRTLAQLLEEGQLNELMKSHENHQRQFNNNLRSNSEYDDSQQSTKANPFARPEKPPVVLADEVINTSEQNNTIAESNENIENEKESVENTKNESVD